MRTLKATSLILDFTVYPRVTVDSTHVGMIAQAMQAGAKLPPIVICRKSRRVVDGFHRVKAALRIDKEEATLQCVEKTYRNEGLLFLDAVRYNADHGRALTTYDRAHIALVGEKMKIVIDDLAAVMHVDPSYVGKLVVDTASLVGGLRVPLKRTIRHMAGQELTEAQAKANEKLGGMTPIFYINQVISLIENDLLDRKNESLLQAIDRLRKALAKLKIQAA